MSLKPVSPYNRGTRQRAISINRTLIPSPEELNKNILGVFSTANEEELLAGATWYDYANVEAERIGSGNIRIGAGIIAALSPQNSWGQNIIDAWNLLHYRPVTSSTRDTDRALAILGGMDPWQVLGGRKTRSFYANILYPQAVGPVTVDRHAMAAAVLGPGHWSEAIRQYAVGRLLERVGTYQVVAGAYRSAARRVGLMPHQTQAICWLAWRRGQAISWANNDPF